MAPVVDKPDGRSFTELTRQLFGKPLSMNEAWELVETIEIEPPAEAVAASPETVWIGSVGYERHKDNRTSRGYKSGQADEGRRRYGAFLLAERQDALRELAVLLGSKRTALMCVEHDAAACHHSVIIDALRDELGMELEVADIA